MWLKCVFILILIVYFFIFYRLYFIKSYIFFFIRNRVRELLLLLFLTSHLFSIAPLFLWVLATIPYFHLPCHWPHYNLKRLFDPYMHVLVMWLSILESCQVYVVFVFMGAMRVNSSLDTWEIECISCEAWSLYILELIYYLVIF